MDPKSAEEIRGRLLEQRAQVVAAIADHDQEQKSGSPDPGEPAALLARGEVADRLSDDERRLIDKIDLALRRLDDGSYGRCAGCGTAIPWERLQTKPSVSLCLACQQRQDAGQPVG